MNKPEDADKYGWGAFEEYADEQGINLLHEEDFSPWWECWTTAIDAANTAILDSVRNL